MGGKSMKNQGSTERRTNKRGEKKVIIVGPTHNRPHQVCIEA